MIILEQTNIIDDIVKSILENFGFFFRGFNFVCYNIFQYGNLILFLFYLVLGGYLLVRAKNVEDKQKIENDKPNTQVNETPENKIKPPEVPPDNPPKDKGNTIINISQQPEKKGNPEKQSKPPISKGEKSEIRIANFIKEFKKFFVKSDEEINKELLKKQYKKSIYEK